MVFVWQQKNEKTRNKKGSPIDFQLLCSSLVRKMAAAGEYAERNDCISKHV
jgi:hypothetical protein